MMDIKQIAKSVGAETYDLCKREAYLNQSRTVFDDAQLEAFAKAAIAATLAERERPKGCSERAGCCIYGRMK